jgi:CelD/BcsL family acetyltransferase involved in cellulose biosynthesis
MKATVEVRDRIEPLVDEWERLARHTGASPFLWPGWVDAWWRAFGAGELRIIAAYENGQLAGVLPTRRLRGVYTLIPNTHTPLSGSLSSSETAAKQLSQALLAEKPRRVELDYISPADAGLSLLFKAAEEAGYRADKKSNPLSEEVPYVAVEGTWDEYNGGLRRKFRSELRRRRRRLEEAGRLTFEVFDGTQRLDELLEEGFRVEGSGWKGEYGTSINARPELRRLYTVAASWAAGRDMLRLGFVRLDGRVLAFDYSLEHNRVHYLLKTGYDPAHRNLAPGLILRYLMLERAFSEELAIYDFCGENWAWKGEWTSLVQERAFFRIFAPTAIGSLDRAVFEYGGPASERAKGLARSVLGERGRHLVKRGRGLARGWLGR